MHIAAIDAGSSSMRGVLFDPEGRVLVREQRSYTMERTPDGGAEMDVAVFARVLDDILRTLASRACAASLPIEALVLTSQRSSVVAVDRQGHALRPILMWHDKRSAPLCAAIDGEAGAALYERSGMPASPVFSAPKMLL